MGICLELVDHDQAFRSAVRQPIVINDLASVTEEQRNFIDRITTTQYDTDLVSNEPQCSCGATRGGWLIGTVCPECNTSVVEMFDEEIAPIAWIRAPDGVEALINPMVLNQLNQVFTSRLDRSTAKNNFPYFAWLINTDMVARNRHEQMVCEAMLAAGLERGYNNFVRNFDDYIDTLFMRLQLPSTAVSKRPATRTIKGINLDTDEFRWIVPYFPDVPDHIVHPLHAQIRVYRDRVFSRYVPLPNKSLLVLENTSYGCYVDPVITEVIDAIKSIRSIDTAINNISRNIDAAIIASREGIESVRALTIRQKENRTAKTLLKLVEFQESVYRGILGTKPGILRKHVYGTRNCWSMRCVISSITWPHDHKVIETPWAATITMLKTHLMSKLLRRGYTPNEATGFIQSCTYKHHPLMDQLLQELLDEAPDGKINVVFNRNPSLTRASAQSMMIGSFKRDPDDNTIGVSSIALKGFNALEGFNDL